VKEVKSVKTRWIKLCLGFATVSAALPFLGAMLNLGGLGFHDGDL
jgi:hypothetical protein